MTFYYRNGNGMNELAKKAKAIKIQNHLKEDKTTKIYNDGKNRYNYIT